MKMNINRISSANNVSGIYRKNQSDFYKTENKTIKKDALVLSKGGQIFNEALKALKAMPEVSETKVNEIKNSIKNGSYNVSSVDIADKMIKGFNFDKLV
ncbi:MAG: flagellar biosynthesis anti-sigma factor FlgM [Eubacteriales bacterium]|nr:flagellar biosynthesis anti-sigma factor FlgM [Eubacteriales bacterium]